MVVARRRLKVKVRGKVKVMGQVNALGPTSVEGSIFSSYTKAYVAHHVTERIMVLSPMAYSNSIQPAASCDM